ncbi:MAG: DUF1223 domain-containing protein [Paracoccus sp. (in: a-proteobacteria)]|nr:DUF1223 domain-containing protein [Paracoccus sp. (in: a-proteobacteria)]
MQSDIRGHAALIGPVCLALLGLLAAPAMGFDADDTPDTIQQEQDRADYKGIMDDVDAIIDAMDEIGIGPRMNAAPPSAISPAPRQNHSGSSRAAPRSPQAPMPQGPRIPSPIVIELFTAQGCAACPPAEDLLGSLLNRPEVLVLSWHVDYWDYLGWTDTFARPEFAARQKGYNLLRGARSLFTPQMIVAGEIALDDASPAGLMNAVQRERAEGDHVAITRRQNGQRSEIELTPLTALPDEITVQMIRYIPARQLEVKTGENAGRHLKMHNVVIDAEVLARWDGKVPLRMNVTLGAGPARSLPADTRHAIIVQHMHAGRPGEIFATILLD